MNQRSFQAFHPSSFSISVLAFCWTLLGSLLLQLVVLPALPTLHAGHGLLQGGDWIAFHKQSVVLALQMAQDGWGIWELRPYGHAPVGLLSALYFVVGIYEPWVFLPINALLFGAAAFILHKIFKLIMTTQHSFFAVLPFVMFPSALIIYGQIHKDIFSATGILFIIFVWADLAGRATLKWHEMLVRIAMIVTGLALIWLVRPYLLQSLLAAGLCAAMLLSVWAARGRSGSWWCALAIFLTIQVGAVVGKMPSSSPAQTAQTGQKAKAKEVLVLGQMVSQVNKARASFATSSPNAGSNIDIEVRFTSTEDLLLYLPRALQIGLLSPFPSMWLGDARSPGGGIMRTLAAMEMTLSYVFLLGLLGLWRCQKECRVSLMVVVIMSLVITLILTLVVTNVGTVYRMRYGTWQLLNGLGILGWSLWLQARHKEKNG